MANGSPMDRDNRTDSFRRSHSITSVTQADVPTTTTVSRLHEPRLSIGASIRDFERRTAEVPTLLRDQIQTVIGELRPLVERARHSDGSGLPFWLTQPAQQATPSLPSTSARLPNTPAEDVVITLDGSDSRGESVAPTMPSSNTPEVAILPVTPTQAQIEAEGDNITTNHNVTTPSDAGEVFDQTESLVLNTFLKYFPFIAIIITKFIFDHIPGIILYLALVSIFQYFNMTAKREACRQTPRNFPVLLFLIGHVIFAIIVISYIINNEMVVNLILGTVSMHEVYVQSMGDLIWSVIVTDYVLKIITIVFKIVLSLMPTRVIPTSKRGKWFLFVEATSQLYRAVVPVQPWLNYLLDTYKGPKKIFGVFLSAAYMVCKGNQLMGSWKLWWSAVLKIIRNVTIGITPTKDQVVTAGNICSICHDEFKTPVLLECKHIFCESCVCKWLDREQTCPLCRARIADDPSWRDGSTTFFIQVF